MKKTGLLIFICLLAFFSCSDDDGDGKYHVPVFNFEEYLDLLEVPLDVFTLKYPYAVINNEGDTYSQLVINSGFKDFDKSEIKTQLYFENDICNSIALEGLWYTDEGVDWFYMIAEEITEFTGNPYLINLNYNEEDTWNSIQFGSYQELKDWITNIKTTNQEVTDIDIYWDYVAAGAGTKQSGHEIQGILIHLDYDFYRYDHNGAVGYRQSFDLYLGNGDL